MPSKSLGLEGIFFIFQTVRVVSQTESAITFSIPTSAAAEEAKTTRVTRRTTTIMSHKIKRIAPGRHEGDLNPIIILRPK